MPYPHPCIGRGRRQRYIAHARQRFHITHHLPQISVQLRRVGKSLVGDRQSGGQHIGRIESRIHLLHLEETANQQPGAGEQHERQRHFRHHQRAADFVPPARTGAPAAFFHTACQIRPCRLHRRHQSENDPRENRQRQREQQDPRVDRNIGFAGQRKRRHCQYQAGLQRQSQGPARARRRKWTAARSPSGTAAPASTVRRQSKRGSPLHAPVRCLAPASGWPGSRSRSAEPCPPPTAARTAIDAAVCPPLCPRTPPPTRPIPCSNPG